MTFHSDQNELNGNNAFYTLIYKLFKTETILHFCFIFYWKGLKNFTQKKPEQQRIRIKLTEIVYWSLCQIFFEMILILPILIDDVALHSPNALLCPGFKNVDKNVDIKNIDVNQKNIWNFPNLLAFPIAGYEKVFSMVLKSSS